MKIYLWDENVEALQQHELGSVVAVAESKEEAIALTLKHFRNKHEKRYLTEYITKVRERLERNLRETEPLIFDLPFGYTMYGTD